MRVWRRASSSADSRWIFCVIWSWAWASSSSFWLSASRFVVVARAARGRGCGRCFRGIFRAPSEILRGFAHHICIGIFDGFVQFLHDVFEFWRADLREQCLQFFEFLQGVVFEQSAFLQAVEGALELFGCGFNFFGELFLCLARFFEFAFFLPVEFVFGEHVAGEFFEACVEFAPALLHGFDLVDAFALCLVRFPMDFKQAGHCEW